MADLFSIINEHIRTKIVIQVHQSLSAMHIKSILLICVCFVLFQPAFLSAQQIKKAPTQYSFEIGYRNLFSHSNNINLNNSHGYGVLFDYAWQLSGFDGTKNASYISVPIGYTILPGNDALSKSVNMLNYGWTVRHELGKNKKVIPFVGYGLLLNNMRITKREGSVFGHQTQFDLGVNFHTRTRLIYFAKVQYSYTSYPQFDQEKRFKLHYADLRVGIRF